MNCCESISKYRSNQKSYNLDEHIQVTNDVANNFAESCRLDNLNASSNDNNSHHNSYGMRSGMHHSQTPSTRSILNYAHGNSNVTSSNHSTLLDSNRENVNSHPKLRRQLSLNPNACDPRLNRMQSSNLHSQLTPSEQQMHQQSQHRLLAPSHSGPRSQHIQNQWDLHQVNKKKKEIVR